MNDSTERIVDLSRRMAASLGPQDLDATLRNITQGAVRLLPEVDHASITTRHSDGRLDTRAMTDDLLLELDRKQVEWREGPCYDGATDEPFVVADDLRTDPRYPRYGALASRAGVLSQAGLRLFESDRSIGALNLYSRKVGGLASLDPLGRLFADQAAIAISYAVEVQNLNEALRTRTVIGQAVGLVMERYHLGDDRAFAFLTRLSSHRNVKLRRVAEELVADAMGKAEEEPR